MVATDLVPRQQTKPPLHLLLVSELKASYWLHRASVAFIPRITFIHGYNDLPLITWKYLQ